MVRTSHPDGSKSYRRYAERGDQRVTCEGLARLDSARRDILIGLNSGLARTTTEEDRDVVAERLKINQQTARNWIDQGSLPAVRVGAGRCGSASRTSMRSSPLAKASCRRLRSGHAEQWKEVLAAAEAVSNAARLRDQAVLRAAMSALSHAAEQFGSAD